MQRCAAPRIIWVPLVMMGSLLYWTVAMGLGGLSLSFLGEPAVEELELEPAQPAPPPSTSDEPILVHLQKLDTVDGIAAEAPPPPSTAPSTEGAEDSIDVGLQDATGAFSDTGAAGVSGAADDGTAHPAASSDSPGRTAY